MMGSNQQTDEPTDQPTNHTNPRTNPQVHRMFWDPREVQQCTLLSIKTGGCTEDCKYCSQVSGYIPKKKHTGLHPTHAS